MADPNDMLGTDDIPSKQLPWGVIITVVVGLVLVVLTFWAMREKRNEKARAAVLEVLDQELELQQQAIKAQREKIVDLTRQVETLRTSIQLGQVRNGKAAVAEFNKLAAEQRAERDRFAQMAEEYNKKVAKYRDLQE